MRSFSDILSETSTSRRGALQLFGAVGAGAGLAGAGLLSGVGAGSAQAATAHAVATGDVHFRKGPSMTTTSLAIIHKGAVVVVTGPLHGAWYPVSYGGRSGYVSSHYLKLTSATGAPAPVTKPTPAKPGVRTVPMFFTSPDANMAVCERMPAAKTFHGPQGVTANGKRIASIIHEEFPQVSLMGGYRHEVGSDHDTGHAVDIMLPGNYTSADDKALGAMIAYYLQTNYKVLDVKYIIYFQHIWGEYRQQDGWRLMADRGSDNQNHKNHVHVSYY